MQAPLVPRPHPVSPHHSFSSTGSNDAASLPRFEGWWGHDVQRRFLMEPEFAPLRGAEGWQLSNPPILYAECRRGLHSAMTSRAGTPVETEL